MRTTSWQFAKIFRRLECAFAANAATIQTPQFKWPCPIHRMQRIFFFRHTWFIQKKCLGRGYLGTGWNIAGWVPGRGRFARGLRIYGLRLRAPRSARECVVEDTSWRYLDKPSRWKFQSK